MEIECILSTALKNRVILTDTALFGSSLRFLGIGPSGINDAGQIAFDYELANGTRGIALAIPVPEPSGFALLALGGAAVVLCARWRLRRCANKGKTRAVEPQ